MINGSGDGAFGTGAIRFGDGHFQALPAHHIFQIDCESGWRRTSRGVGRFASEAHIIPPISHVESAPVVERYFSRAGGAVLTAREH
jgi:hypothetical protein